MTKHAAVRRGLASGGASRDRSGEQHGPVVADAIPVGPPPSLRAIRHDLGPSDQRRPTCSIAPRAGLVATRSTFPRGFRGGWQCVDRAQLIYPSRGVMTFHTRAGAWVVPPLRGCWAPATADHAIEASTGLELHSVYCDGLAAIMPARCAIVPVSPLLRELILALGEMAEDYPGATLGEKLHVLIARQLAPPSQPPLFLPQVSSPPLRRIAEALRQDPADGRTLEAWSREVGATPRSLARAFAREAQMSFTEFRRQIRLHAALEKLGEGVPVTVVAMDLGFSSAANFISMFRRATGFTPKAYFAQRR